MIGVSIVIPTYNENKNIPLLVEEIFECLDTKTIEAEIIIVDDNSPDGTGATAESLKKSYPIQVIHRSGKLGLGSAVRAGFEKARYPIIGVMDADLSHDPVILNDLIGSLQEVDIAIGSRFAVGSVVESWEAWRKKLSQTGVFLAGLLTGVKDPLSGYFFFKREVIAGVPLTTTGFKILLEILVKGKHGKVKEIPFKFRVREYSVSKLGPKEYVLFIKQIIQYSWYKLFKK